jgi:hypothetical protein
MYPHGESRPERHLNRIAGEISARSVEAIDEADLDRVGALHKNNRDRLGCRFGCERTICALQYNDHGYLTANQFGNERREPIVSTLCPPVFNCHVLAFDVTGILQASAKSGEVLAVGFERCEVKKPDHGRRGLLCGRRDRPCCRRASNRFDEIAASHGVHPDAQDQNPIQTRSAAPWFFGGMTANGMARPCSAA